MPRQTPDLPRDQDVVTRGGAVAPYTSALGAQWIFWADSFYMNHEANARVCGAGRSMRDIWTCQPLFVIARIRLHV